MASDEHLPHGRSSRRAPRTFHDLQASNPRSFFAGKKTPTKSVSDKLLWFSPVHSPLLSPAREKPVAKKKGRQSSIFSIQSRGKGSIVAEEPTSPKVSCIGQVRGQKKDKDPLADAIRKKCSQSRPGSMSPARFFASPARSSKWGSLFSSRKDPCATNSISSGNGGGDQSCFGFPLDSRSAFQPDKTCSFLARCPDLSREHRSSDNCHNDRLIVPVTNAPISLFEDRAASVPANRCIDAISAEKFDWQSIMPDYRSHFPQKHEGGEKHARVQSKHSDVGHLTGIGNSSQADLHNGTIAMKQRLNYEDLPSLNCGAYMKQNMKISVDIVPETWLWRDGENLGVDSTSRMAFVQERSRSNSREDLQNAQHEEHIMPLSPCINRWSNTKDGEQCVDYEIISGQSHVKGFEAAEKIHVTSDCLVEASLNFVNDSPCKPSDGDKKTINGRERTSSAKLSQSQVVESPCSVHVVAAEEKKEEPYGGACAAWSSSCFQVETNRIQIRKQQVHIDKSIETDVDKSGGGKESSEVKPSLQTMRRIGVDLGKENYSIAFSSLLERNLPSQQSKEDGRQFWSMFKGQKAEACSEQPFGALILVGYDQLTAPNNLVCNNKNLFKGLLEVGKLSFHGSGKYFQVLNSDAAFNRSRSATSVRTVIRLQRCNSDPCRPSY